MAFPDTWGPYFFISITPKGGTEVQLAPAVDLSTLEISEGDFPIEGLPNGAGGRVVKESPQEDGEVSFEIFPQELDNTAAKGLFQQFYGSNDAVEPLTTGTSITASVSRTRAKYQIAVLFTNDGAAAAAATATGASTDSLRFIATDCRMISHKPTMTDGILKIPVTFKYPATTRTGHGKNGYWESGDQTALVVRGY